MGRAVWQTVIGIYTLPTQMPLSVTLSIVLCNHNLSLPLPLVRSLFFVAYLIMSHRFILINLFSSSFWWFYCLSSRAVMNYFCGCSASRLLTLCLHVQHDLAADGPYSTSSWGGVSLDQYLLINYAASSH